MVTLRGRTRDDSVRVLVDPHRLDHRRLVDTEHLTPYVGTEQRRSPHLVWEPSANGGFTDPGAVSWLPLGDISAHSLAGQRDDPRSLLSLCRRLIAIRRHYIKGRGGSYEELVSAEHQWVYRSGDVLVAANFSDEPAEMGGVTGPVLSSSLGVLSWDEPVAESLRPTGFEAVVVKGSP